SVRGSGPFDFGHEPVRDTSRPALLSRPVPLRPRTLDAGGERVPPEIFLLSLRWWPAPVHRRELRLDGRLSGIGDPRATLQDAPCAGTSGRASAARHASAETWDADDPGTAIAKSRMVHGFDGWGQISAD